MARGLALFLVSGLLGLGSAAGCVDEFADDGGESVGETSDPVAVEQPCTECLNRSWEWPMQALQQPAPARAGSVLLLEWGDV